MSTPTREKVGHIEEAARSGRALTAEEKQQLFAWWRTIHIQWTDADCARNLESHQREVLANRQQADAQGKRRSAEIALQERAEKMRRAVLLATANNVATELREHLSAALLTAYPEAFAEHLTFDKQPIPIVIGPGEPVPDAKEFADKKEHYPNIVIIAPGVIGGTADNPVASVKVIVRSPNDKVGRALLLPHYRFAQSPVREATTKLAAHQPNGITSVDSREWGTAGAGDYTRAYRAGYVETVATLEVHVNPADADPAYKPSAPKKAEPVQWGGRSAEGRQVGSIRFLD